MVLSSLSIYGRAIMLNNILGLNTTVDPRTTLNKKLNVNIESIEGKPIIQYFGLGVLEKDIDLNTPIDHNPSDAVLFNQIPLKMEPYEDNGVLDDSYSMLATKIVDGVKYNCYYLKKINIRENKIFKISGEIDNPEIDFHDFNEPNILNPVYKDLNVRDDYLVASNKIIAPITNTEMKNINEVIRILYPNNDVFLAELGLFSGIENKGDLFNSQLCFSMGLNESFPMLDVEGFLIDIGGDEYIR